jgi:hypothetical protein
MNGLMRRSNEQRYSMTSSARASSMMNERRFMLNLLLPESVHYTLSLP